MNKDTEVVGSDKTAKKLSGPPLKKKYSFPNAPDGECNTGVVFTDADGNGISIPIKLKDGVADLSSVKLPSDKDGNDRSREFARALKAAGFVEA